MLALGEASCCMGVRLQQHGTGVERCGKRHVRAHKGERSPSNPWVSTAAEDSHALVWHATHDIAQGWPHQRHGTNTGRCTSGKCRERRRCSG